MKNTQLVKVGEGREGMSFGKVGHFFKVMAGATRGADAYLDKFAHFDVSKLRVLTGKKIENLLLDVDACIAPPYDEILEENIAHVRGLLDMNVRVGIYSNCQSMERLRPMYELGIRSYEGKHPKPLREGFLAACDEFKFDPATTWMAGDNPNTDGGAIGVLEGMAFVDPLPENVAAMSWKKRIISPFQRFFRRAAILRSVTGNNSLITSRHIDDLFMTESSFRTVSELASKYEKGIIIKNLK